MDRENDAMGRLQGVPGLVVGLVVLVLAIGIGVYLTAGDSVGGGGPGDDSPVQERAEDRMEAEKERLEEARESRKQRAAAPEDSGHSDSG